MLRHLGLEVRVQLRAIERPLAVGRRARVVESKVELGAGQKTLLDIQVTFCIF